MRPKKSMFLNQHPVLAVKQSSYQPIGALILGVELGYCLLSRKRMLMQEHALLKSCAMFILDLCMRTISESSPF